VLQRKTVYLPVPAIVLYPIKDERGNFGWQLILEGKTVSKAVASLEEGLKEALKELEECLPGCDKSKAAVSGASLAGKYGNLLD
jgi:hypothetical protein